ncbi:MAG: D-tyrosyl-tRNA(Tyr) deacylase [Flavobacteriales bacterium]|nr:D-tyrosyl-tRNA(Tyr) deacylase [Flavobacteriales bacterium]MBT4478096.1 D-tyrosyl-tRNA(Tyr) deacylase [Flavobacteriales bacterium]MBT6013628.1 D-tyrosyl-tRNA(Tyr) deacylase [Flavobacteriales bacterium]MBT7481857.1 D-tyrosyl-tRNA(Tyr) deacylase [Flavobacteriales bacterium]
MRAVIQRVSESSVQINKQNVAQISTGLLILLGIEIEDTKEDSVWLSNKISQLRIFSDTEGKMNKSIIEIGGEVIVISQFTLHAKTKKGNRPSYIKSARPEQAIPLYEQFKENLSLAIGKEVQSGEFGADMKVILSNDGPVTIIIDTKNKE